VSFVPGVASVSGLSICAKKKRKQKGQAQIDNPDTLATPGTKDT
jgi:hypothetical protein